MFILLPFSSKILLTVSWFCLVEASSPVTELAVTDGVMLYLCFTQYSCQKVSIWADPMSGEDDPEINGEVPESWSFPKVSNIMQMENTGLKQLKSSWVNLIKNINFWTYKLNRIWNILIKQRSEETVTAFIMFLNALVSIIWCFQYLIKWTAVFRKYVLELLSKITFAWIQAGNSYPSWLSISRSNTAVFPATLFLLSSWLSVLLFFSDLV